jgi:hypothetical protein
MNEDELFDDGEAVPFDIPVTSCAAAIQRSRMREAEETKAMIQHQHDVLLEYEKQNLTAKAKQFELLRKQEECMRYHSLLAEKEVSDGRTLADRLVTNKSPEVGQKKQPQSSSPPSSATPSTEVIRQFLTNYMCVLDQSKKTNPSNAAFPWVNYDESVQLSCLQLLRDEKVDDCRSYLIGYMECVGRVPFHEQTNQGKVFTTSVAWALGRHPFGSMFAQFVVAVKILAVRIEGGLLQRRILCEKVKEFVTLLWRVWAMSWPQVEKCSDGVQNDLSELLIEGLQHVLFLSIPEIMSLFRNDEGMYTKQLIPPANAPVHRPGSEGQAPSSSAGSINLSIEGLRINGVPGVDTLTVSNLEDICGVPGKFRSSGGDNMNVSATLSAISSHPLVSLSSYPLESGDFFARNPYNVVAADILVLRNTKTPLEVVTVLTAIVENVMSVSARILDRGGFPVPPGRDGASVDRTSGGTPSNPTTLGPLSTVAADELVPLISFSFALYFTRCKLATSRRASANVDFFGRVSETPNMTRSEVRTNVH